MRTSVVWNPSKTERADLTASLERAGVDPNEVDWYETTKDDPGQDVTRRAIGAGTELILVAGGDGTVRAAAEAVAEADGDAPELAIIPLGTGNLLARNLDVPLRLDDAVAHAFSSTARQLDLGWVRAQTSAGEERHAFAVMVGFGLDANMISETDDDLKQKAGWLAYVESLGRAISASDVVHVNVTIDGEEQEADAHTLIIGNCGMIQGGITLLPDARPDDGRLDLLLLSSEGIGGWLDTLRTMVWDNGIARLLPGSTDEATSTETTTYASAEHISVTLPKPRPFQIDGEEVGKVSQFDITIQPGALRVR